MSSELDPAVIAAAQAGDGQARDQLVTASMPLVYNIVGRALHGHADVDDVAQETMLRALGSLGDLRDPGSFRSWLVAITMNQIRAHWRQDQAVPVAGGLDDAYDVPDPRADFVGLTIVRLGLSGQRREVAEATRWLDEGDRALLSLWWLEAAGELTRAEVAVAMELTPQHTAVRVQRMKSQLEASRVVVRALSAEPRCVLLDTVTEQWDGVPSALWRKRIARHARECTVCSSFSSGLVPADRLLVGLALVPLAAALAPDTMETPVLAAAASQQSVSAMSAAVGGAAPAPATGPATGGGRAQLRDALRESRRVRRRRAVTAAAVAAAALATVGGALPLFTGGPDDEPGTPRAATEPGSAPLATPSATPPTPSPSRTSSSPSPTPSPSASSSKEPHTPRKKRAPSEPAAPAPRPSSAAPAPAPASGSGSGGSAFAQQVTTLVNAERAKQGCSPVHANNQLVTAARRHSQDMDARNYFDHTSPDGTDPGDRITAAGYRWSTYGENIARGQRSADNVMKSWMNSPGHRANILNCDFKEIGIGTHDTSGGPTWTQVFGARG
ncbi:sigma-70 family RNA polymerase sigma factor [Streptomyces monomycini]|uniref:sigma-70 family RNA polymerase sigma factor n=1 Tax=Streptomyces monomycini TaxID=371720 RepID=UPI0004AB7AB9|nr:sigma-70 family RNA polymerase sigma factor [Streptomyces monomycini]